ncbi:uncharacterized protein LOC129765631 [Toxorhynchites rutilus septentrionalis]|uniref:uncharacterized protein LOC129765631 n=1 Tax=Toxorhynchites rutilus septentrionalis TaxID=329112 RepID=UPI0024787DAE|nr:uncharacterized protein LOC129765631 [Toxorhynchites rutilus septentrionalis]
MRSTDLGRPNWREKVCYRCSKSDHVADNCPEKPKPRKCFRCGSERHLAKNCSLSRNGEYSRPVKAIDVDDEFEKLVSVGEFQMMALIDNGSKVTTIKNSMARKFGNSHAADVLLKGFGGRRIRVTEKVVAALKVDEIEEKVDFLVVPNFAQELPVIVGTDVLKRETVVMTKKEGRVWLENGECEKNKKEGPNNEKSVREVLSIQVYEPVKEADFNTDGVVVRSSELLKCVEENRDCFSKNVRELGKAKFVELDIVLHDPQPVYEKPYKMEFSREQEIK